MSREKNIARAVCFFLLLLLAKLFVGGEEEAFPKLYADGHKASGDGMQEDGRTEQTTLKEDKKMVYLTFDDGPSRHTERVLDVLKEYDVRAAFFVIGKDLTEEGCSLLQRAVQEGHVIGLHTYSHNYRKIYASVESFLSDYDLLRETLQKALGFSPEFFRFPGGSFCSYAAPIRKELIEEMERRGYVYYDWNVSGEDSVGTVTAASIWENIFSRVDRVEAPVILLHDSAINELTVRLLPEIIEGLREKGYTFGTLTERTPIHFGENYR